MVYGEIKGCHLTVLAEYFKITETMQWKNDIIYSISWTVTWNQYINEFNISLCNEATKFIYIFVIYNSGVTFCVIFFQLLEDLPAPQFYNYHNPGHYPLACLLFKNTTFSDWILSQETDTISFCWAHLSMFHHKKERDSSLRNVVF
jgi:hypothetical protein